MLDTKRMSCEGPAVPANPALAFLPAVATDGPASIDTRSKLNPGSRTPMTRLLLHLPWLALPLLLLAGCQSNEEITSYQVDRPEVRTLDPREDARLLALIIPRGEQNWFFKFLALAGSVAEHQTEFTQLIQSVKLDDKANPPITWTLPKGWKQLPGKGERFATLQFGPADKPLEVTVTRFGGNLLSNVNRWRINDVGLRALRSEAEVYDLKLVKDLTIDNARAFLVDLTGPGGDKFKRPGAVKPDNPHAPADNRISYTVPEGWKAARPRSPISYAAFRLPESTAASPEVAITPMAGGGGALLANLNMWHSDIGLKTELTEMPKDLKAIEVAGKPCTYVDVSGAAGPAQQRMLIVTCKDGDTTWYFKLQAAADVVAKNQSAFEAFVKSVRFDAGPGAKQ